MATNIELALMAGRAYQSTRTELNWFPTPQGWTIIGHPNDPSGFEAVTFQRGDEIVISFAGTYDKDISGDIAADIALGNGHYSEQLKQAAEYYLQVKSANPDAKITLTGHSLGGGLASLIAVFFDEDAATFDQAPFRLTAAYHNPQSPDLDPCAFLLSVLQDNDQIDQSLLQPLEEYVNAMWQGSLDVLQEREQDVTNTRVEGEKLSSELPYTLFDTIGTTVSELKHGDTEISGWDLHSIALLTAFVQNPTFREVTNHLTDLLEMIFDTNLFYSETDTTIPNFLEHLLRHEFGNAPGVTTADGMLDRFTQDLQLIAQEGGLSMSDITVTKTLTAFAMQAYYENRLADDETLFEEISGGLHFDRSKVADDLVNEAKGFYLYFVDYLATKTVEERAFLQEQLPSLLDWFIQTGSVGMTATAGEQRAFMLGGSDSDTLTGSSQADVLLGNDGADTLAGGDGNDILDGGLGQDTLKGGAGHDIYYVGEDDIANDSDNQGTIWFKGQQLPGLTFTQQSENGKYYENADNSWRAVLDDDGTLRLSEGNNLSSFSIENFTAGNYGITLAEYEMPQGSYDYELIGSDDGNLVDIWGNEEDGWEYNFLAWNGSEYGDSLFYRSPLTSTSSFEVFGGSSSDRLAGLPGSDHLVGGAGNDVILGFDSLQASESPLGNVDQAGDLLEGGSGKDWIRGAGGDDVIFGGNDMDFLASAFGDDQLNGGDGHDVLAGGADNDILTGDSGDDLLLGDGVFPLIDFTFEDLSLFNITYSYDTNGFANGYTTSGFAVDTDEINVGNDVLDGGAGRDMLYGGGGNDILLGGDDADSLIGGTGNDNLSGGAGNDLLVGDNFDQIGSGADILYGGSGDDQLQGAGGNDTLYGEADNDLLFGQQGNDTLSGGAGDDQLQGGDGDDKLSGDAGDDFLFGEAGNDILSGGSGIDELQGGDGNDLLEGDADNDRLFGGDGDDILDGGTGADYLTGEADNDTYLFRPGAGMDSIDDQQGINTIHFTGSTSLTNLEFMYATTNSSGDVNYDAAGQDLVIRYGSGDTLVINNGRNSNFNFQIGGAVYGQSELLSQIPEYQEYGDGGDSITATDNNDRIYAGGGNDTVYAGAGNDIVAGGCGVSLSNVEMWNLENYLLNLGIPIDALSLSCPREEIIVNNNDSLYGGVGNDFLDGGIGYDNLYGGTGNDTLYGGADQDNLYGEDGNDTLRGGAGNDFLDGGAGADVVDGGDGIDRVGYQNSSAGVTINLDSGIANGGDAEGDTLMGIENIYGSIYSDTLIGTEDQNTIDGGGGDNTIYGAGGNDEIESGGGNDLIYGGAGNDRIFSGGGNSQLFGEAGDDYIWGAGAWGSGEVNFISGGEGNDELHSGCSSDIIEGGEGNDQLFGADGNDILRGGEGDDILDARGSETWDMDSIDMLEGGVGNDTYIVQPGNSGVDFINDLEGINTIQFYPDNWTGSPVSLADLEIYYFDANLNDINMLMSYNDYQNGTEQEQLHGYVESIHNYAGELPTGEGGFAIEPDGPDLLIRFGESSYRTDAVIILGGRNNLDFNYDFGNGNIYNHATILDHVTIVGPPVCDYDIGLQEDQTISGILEFANPEAGIVFDIEQNSSNGTFTLNVDGNWSYLPDENYHGSDTVVINVTNSTGMSASSTINLTITPVNDAPIIEDNEEPYQLLGTLVQEGDVSASDVDGDSLIYGVDTLPEHGSFAINDTGHWAYTADDSYCGADTAIVSIDDGNGGTAITTLNFSVNVYSGGDLTLEGDGSAGLLLDSASQGDLQLDRQGDDLNIAVGDQGTVTLKDYFTEAENGIDWLQTTDGTVSLAKDAIQEGGSSWWPVEWFSGQDGANDLMSGTWRSDFMYGLGGNDILFGGDGIDALYGNDGDDTLVGGDGYDLLVGGNGSDTLLGDSGWDFLNGNSGADALVGGEGNDLLLGGSGNDRIWGDQDNDILSGGTDNDTYHFSLGDGQDTLYDESGTDTITFAADVTKEEVVFLKTGTTMKIGYGIDDQITMNSYGNSETGNRIETITLADGSTMTDADINQLIQEMSAYAITEGISLNSIDEVKQQEPLMAMIADTWHAA